MTIMRHLVAKPISMTLNLMPKYGYCHMSALTHLPVPCISGFLALISPRALPIQGLNPPKSPRLATVKAVHSPCCCIYGPIPVLARIQYPIFRERTNSFKTGRGVVPGGTWQCDFPGRTKTNGDRKTVLISRRQTYTVNHYIGAANLLNLCGKYTTPHIVSFSFKREESELYFPSKVGRKVIGVRFESATILNGIK